MYFWMFLLLIAICPISFLCKGLSNTSQAAPSDAVLIHVGPPCRFFFGRGSHHMVEGSLCLTTCFYSTANMLVSDLAVLPAHLHFYIQLSSFDIFHSSHAILPVSIHRNLSLIYTQRLHIVIYSYTDTYTIILVHLHKVNTFFRYFR